MKNLKLRAQDAYLALYPQSKKPVGVNWPGQGKSEEEALAAKGNLGLLLGPKSGVIDVDLDCPEANGLADLVLPQPRCPKLCNLRASTKKRHRSQQFVIVYFRRILIYFCIDQFSSIWMD